MSRPFEIIFVNDGSRDRSLEIIRDLAAKDPSVRAIDLSRNFGHQAAFYAGIRRARGRAVVLMDADLQDRPEEIAEMKELAIHEKAHGGAH